MLSFYFQINTTGVDPKQSQNSNLIKCNACIMLTGKGGWGGLGIRALNLYKFSDQVPVIEI